jgi:glycerol-3-phosphate dehydrogenase
VAEKTIDVAFAKLGRPPRPSLSRTTPLWGGSFKRFDAFLDQAMDNRLWKLNARITRHLVYSYGSAYAEVLKLIRENLVWSETVAESAEVIKAEIVYAIRHEMAVTLADVVLRRTDLAALGAPTRAALEECAAIMAVELEWDAARIERELRAVDAECARHGWRSAMSEAAVPVAGQVAAR